MKVKRIKREGIKSVRKRLREQAPEVIVRREVNHAIQRERQRRTLASNAQALHGRYVGDIQKGPHMDGVRMFRVNRHKEHLRELLTNMNAFQDPIHGIPPY